jgi:hypothetical protein
MKPASSGIGGFLAVSGVGLAALIALYWLVVATERPWPQAISPDPAAIAPLSVERRTASVAVAEAMTARPLFVIGRKPVVDPTAATEEAPPARDAFTDARVVGVVGGADGGVAIIARDGTLTRVRKGGQFDGWTLERLENRSAVFSHAGSAALRELRLEYVRTEKVPAAAAATPPPPQPRQRGRR